MSTNPSLKNVNNYFKNKRFHEGLIILKNEMLTYPKNKTIFEQVNRYKKKFKPQLDTSLSQSTISRFFDLHKQGRTKEVITNLEILLRTNPSDYYVLNLLGTFYGLTKNFVNAIKFQKYSIKLNPFDENNYLNLSISLEQNGNLDLSLPFLEIGKLLDPHNININQQLAKIYYKLGKYSQATFIYESLTKLKKNNSSIMLNYIRSLIKTNELQKALSILEKLKINIFYDDNFLTLEGLIYFELDNVEKSKEALKQALNKNSNNSDAYTIYGLIYQKKGELTKALEAHNKSAILNPKNHIAFNNLAACYAFIGKVKLSIINFKKAVAINPYFFDGLYRLGQMQIYNQEFREGWANFKFRWKSRDYFHQYLKTSKPILENIIKNDEKILIWSEQGLGDQVMYGSMFKECSKYLSNLVIKIDKRLIDVFKIKHPNIKFCGLEDKIGETAFDKHIPFGNLGGHLRLRKSDFKKAVFPYISSNKKTRQFIIKKYKNNHNLLVGLSWSSSNHLLSNNKSLSLELLLPILKIRNIKFIDLEYKNSTKEINSFYEKHSIKILQENTIDNFNDIEGLCSIIDVCDFVISCSNTNAHLSGALYKKTFLLLPKGRGRLWNWSSNNGKSQWYPKTEILEQKIVGDWSHPINKLKKEVLKHATKIK